MYDIEIAHSNWFFVIIFLIAIIFVAALYYRNYKVKNNIPKLLRYVVLFLRFSSVLMILFLLLEPSVQKSINQIKKPSISFLIDQSESINLGIHKDSLFFKIDELKSTLKNEFDIKTVYFDKKIHLKTDSLINGQHTNISLPIDYLINHEKGENTVGAILFSDGVHNYGELPLFTSSQAFFPIITTNVGRLTPLKDISIYDVKADNKIELNETLSIDVLLELTKVDDESVKVCLYKNDKLLKVKKVSVNSKRNVSTDFNVKSNKIGYDKYEVKVTALAGEQNTLNNNNVFYVQTYQDRKKVVLLYEYISPDIQYFSRLFQENTSIVFEFKNFKTFNHKSINKNEFYILYDIFTSQKSIDVQEFLTNKNIPYLALIAYNSKENYLGMIKENFGVDNLSDISTIKTFEFNKTFNLLNFSIEQITVYPSINYVPLQFKDVNVSTPIVYSNNVPVILYREFSSPRKILTSLSKLWALRFNENKQIESVFKDLIVSSLQQSKDERIQLLYNQVVTKGEPFSVSVKTLSNSNEFITGLDVFCNISSKEVEELSFPLKENNGKYTTIVKNLNQGNYNIEVFTKLNGKRISKEGKFTVKDYFEEFLVSESDSIMLKKIAKNSNGKYFPGLNTQNIINYINQNFDKTSVNEVSVENKLIINYWYLLIMIVISFGIEWFILKYYNI